MKKKLFTSMAGSLLIAMSQPTFAATAYLPLKKDPVLDQQLERLATLTGMPSLRKPYSVTTINRYLDKLSGEHNLLKSRIARYLSQFKQSSALTFSQVKLQLSDVNDKNLPNSRGATSDDRILIEGEGFFRLNNNWVLNLSASVRDSSDSTLSGTSLAWGNEYLQIDLGYKENWLSPFQDSAMLASTNAQAPVNLSISTPTPLTDWNLDLLLTLGLLEEQQGIRFGSDRFAGRPGYLAMHLSFQPFDWWTIGGNRVFMYGGGERSITAGDMWQAIIDPVSSDNCGGDSPLQDCTQEFGNQQASITSKFDFSLGDYPVSVYFEYAGEDTRGFRNYFLSNRAESLGVYLPYLSSNASLTMEYNYIANMWYTHHLYEEGFRNNRVTMGHWWGDEKYSDDQIGAKVLSATYHLELSRSDFLQITYRQIDNDPTIGDPGLRDKYDYVQGQELKLSYDNATGKHRYGIDFYAGKTVFDQDFYVLSLRYVWD